MTNKPTILFVSHDAGRTGAPIVLLHFLRWLKAHDLVKIELLLIHGGELEKEFEACGRSFIWHEYGVLKGRIQQMREIVFPPNNTYTKRQTQYLNSLKQKGIDLIYLNTVASNSLLPALKQSINCRVICHVHENEYTINKYHRNALSAQNVRLINRFIAASEYTKASLCKHFALLPQQVEVVHEFVPVAALAAIQTSPDKIKTQLQLQNRFIVGGCGITSWRKGIDLFVETAKLVLDSGYSRKIDFVWVGQQTTDFLEEYTYEKQRVGAYNDIKFTGVQTAVADYFNVFDVFFLSSREDPFPLVALEAMALGKPVLCFAETGGIPELVNKGGGSVVPYGNTAAAAAKIVAFYENRQLLREMAALSKEQIVNYDVDVVAPHLFTCINEVLHRNV